MVATKIIRRFPQIKLLETSEVIKKHILLKESTLWQTDKLHLDL